MAGALPFMSLKVNRLRMIFRDIDSPFLDSGDEGW